MQIKVKNVILNREKLLHKMVERKFYVDRLLTEILDECRIYTKDGSVASYIPELKNANPENLGICVIAEEDTFYCAGDYKIEFTMQSIAKPIILLLALMDKGEEEVRKLVGVEATGKPFDAFNYSNQALKRDHINPMINAGAIALCTLINGDTYKEKFSRLLNLIRKIREKMPDAGITTDIMVGFAGETEEDFLELYDIKVIGNKIELEALYVNDESIKNLSIYLKNDNSKENIKFKLLDTYYGNNNNIRGYKCKATLDIKYLTNYNIFIKKDTL